MTAPTIVYLLCFVTSVLCAGLLARAYLRTRTRLLLWCALSFVFLALNNTLVLLDIIWPPEGNLLPLRQTAALGAVVLLIYGFMWEVE
jgi:hypothetical protein